jgi:hypothetical protein
MLAPYVIYLLSFCTLLLLAGWVRDVLRGLLQSPRLEAPATHGLSVNPSQSSVVLSLRH